jgi:RND family efflux transporter MFP subunit
MENISGNTDRPQELHRQNFSVTQKITLVVGIISLAAVIVFGLAARNRSKAVLARTTERAAVPIVNTAVLKLTDQKSELVLPGNTTPYVDAAIYARTSGYLKSWFVDIGGHASQGQELALIETPELDHQVKQAKADLKTAEEAERIAKITADRWQVLLQKDAVSRQETDQYVSDLRSKQSGIESAKANLSRLEQLQSFERVTAPFAGVITARSTDIGALIGAGAGTEPKELFHISDVSRLRIYVSVPEVDLASARDGSQVDLTLDEYPGRTFKGIVVRNADFIDPASRTMRIEIDLDNPKDEVKAGAYVLAHFRAVSKDSRVGAVLTVPANALLFRSEGLSVALFQDGKAQLKPITVGRDFGSTLEILSGLKAGDMVILNPSDSLSSGAYVKEAESAEAYTK